jgi:8-hydroxy-5-deazaflavin:NADPH oxidoreductase
VLDGVEAFAASVGHSYSPPMTRIGVIGSGNIGGTLGERWQQAGHEVVFGARSPQPPRTVAIADAIAGAEVVVLATPGGAVPQLLAEHGPALDGRVVIDATNDIGGERLNHAEAYGVNAPGARFVRAFNTLGFEMFANPSVGGETADLFWCGPEDAGVEQLIADVGLRPVLVGDIDAIEVVDGAARLWLTLVFRQGRPRRLAFRMLAD